MRRSLITNKNAYNCYRRAENLLTLFNFYFCILQLFSNQLVRIVGLYINTIVSKICLDLFFDFFMFFPCVIYYTLDQGSENCGPQSKKKLR